MDKDLNGAYGALRMLEERKAMIEGEAAELRKHLQYLDTELMTLRPAVRELQKSILPIEDKEV